MKQLCAVQVGFFIIISAWCVR